MVEGKERVEGSPSSTVWVVGERFRNWRLDQFLAEQIPKLSRTRIQNVISQRISVSWRKDIRPSTRMQVGGKVIAHFPRLFEVPKDYDFEVLFADENLLAVNKPPGLVVHPTNDCRANSVIELLRRKREEPELRLLHRLDRETSGVLLLARNLETARTWGRAFTRNVLSKIYLARVEGRPKEEEGEVAVSLGQAVRSGIYVRRAAVEGGEVARTHYRILAREKDYSVLELRPATGRRHQLRVHCECLGCPILGDPLYGQSDEMYFAYVKGQRSDIRMHLHAWKLEGIVAGRRYQIETPLPDIFRSLTGNQEFEGS